MLRRTFVSIAILSLLLACQRDAGKAGAAASASSASASAPLQLQEEDVYTVKVNALAAGPVVTGLINPERRADLRAEVASIVTQVVKENGDSVKRGELLMRLDDTAIRESLNSADEAVRAASQSLSQSERQLERLKTLRESGMTSTQSLEDAQLRRNNAQNELVAAKARAVQARQQLNRTEIRAPFDGVVSDRKASVGDTAQLGKELVKVIDPNSMQFEGLVAANRIGELKLGQRVHFKVNGYNEQEFNGSVKRIDPSANVGTRQVALQIRFDDGQQPKVAGLFAEGRIETSSASSLTVPEAVILRSGDKTAVWRVQDKKIARVPLVLGERDPRRGDYVVKSGVQQGDRLLRNPSANVKEGQLVNFSSAGKVASAPAAGASAKTQLAAGK